MRSVASHHKEFLVQRVNRPRLLRVKGVALDIGCSRVNFPGALRDLLQFLIRTAKEELLNARQRKAMGLQDTNGLQLEQMPLPIAAPGAGFRRVQQSSAPVIVKGSCREFGCSLSVGRLQRSIAAPSVDRLCQLLNCPTIHETKV